MSRDYSVVGAIKSSSKDSSLRDVIFDLGVTAAHEAEVSGVFAVSGTDPSPQPLDLSRVPTTKLLYIRVKSGGPFKLFLTSTSGVDQKLPVDDVFFLNLKGAADKITAAKLSGTGTIEFLAAGAST